MMIRHLEVRDIDILRKIHEKHYKKEFSFDDFILNFHRPVVVEDSSGIICAGGIKPILEMVMLTDKDKPVIDRKHAIMIMLCNSVQTSQNLGHHQLHAFVQEEKWKSRLEKTGFKPTKGQSLVLTF